MRGRILAIVGICLMVFAGVAGAVVYSTVTLTPTIVNEGANKYFTLTVTNDASSTEPIKIVNVSLTSFTVTMVLDPNSNDWSHTNGTNWIEWNGTPGQISAGSLGQVYNFWATAPLGIGGDTNDTITVDVFNSTGDKVNTTTTIVTTTDDTANPTTELVSPPDGNFNTNGVIFTCNATDNAELESIAFFWNHSGTWQGEGKNYVSGTSIQTQFNMSSLNDGNYVWGCRACDTAQNCVFSPTNRTITIDTVPPSVTLYSPVSQVYPASSVAVSFAASDANLDSCWYELDGASNTSLPGCANTTFAFADGSHVIILWVNDTATNTNGAGVGFTVDTTNPSAGLGPVPSNDGNVSSSSITFSLYCNDNVGPDELQLWGDWGGWGLKAVNTTPENSTNWEVAIGGIPEGTWTWGSWCNDTADNKDWSDSNRTLNVDRTAPSVGFAAPTPADNTYLPVDFFTINVSHTEARPDTLILYLDGTPAITTHYSGTYSNATMTSSPEGVHTYYVWLNDTAGNTNQTATRTVTIDTTSPLVEFIASTPATDTNIGIPGTLYINISHTELNPGSLILEINGANETQSYTGSLTTITKSYGSGLYNYRVYVNDSAGNYNSTELRNVTFFVPPPPAPPAPGNSFTGLSGGYSAPTCVENWNCTNWSDTCVDFEYTRTCTDLNQCGTENNKPAESIACALASGGTVTEHEMICTPGEMKCSGNNVVICGADMASWKLVTACEHGCENAACKEADSMISSGGEFGLTGMFVGQGANILMAVAGVMILIGGAYYYFRIRRFRVL